MDEIKRQLACRGSKLLESTVENLVDKSPEAAYPIRYAARLAGLDPNTARRWTRGYGYTYRGEHKSAEPIAQLATSHVGPVNVTFEQLLTMRLVRAFREHGLSLQTIKKAAQVAIDHYDIRNPFVSRSFRSDGREVFIDLVQREGVVGSDRILINALSGQQEFHDVVEPSLFKNVVFVGDMPGEWFPLGLNHSVVIRPDRAFGALHIDGSNLRTDVIAAAVTAEGGDPAAAAVVAAWFGIDATKVHDALAAEDEWRPLRAA